MIQLAEAAPALQTLRERMCDREIHSDDPPAAYVRLLCNLPDDTPVVSRVDQLTEGNRLAPLRVKK
jgi:hypothetical protein